MYVQIPAIASCSACNNTLQAGKELIKPEFPLCIRLIGLRVTKLKDLRESAEHGIKRVSSYYRR